MANSTIQIPPDSTGKRLDTEQVEVDALDVQRQRVQVAGSAADGIAAVLADAPGAFEQGLVVRIAGDVPTEGLTDAELRASPVPISGALTDAELRASPVSTSTDGLTDTQLRAMPVPTR